MDVLEVLARSENPERRAFFFDVHVTRVKHAVPPRPFAAVATDARVRRHGIVAANDRNLRARSGIVASI
jgi:hypothetical protein